ncbi:MAG: AsnC family transcriptional regulator [Gammaproteobacteria bacterium]|nr:AsnC family transcriptional regulator [Gammaproteobacteria bacterium]MCW8840849.1 AsnC family transcriptional regulator [Gammaproteobacteria bacterium]MCW8927899.1 AsnC family transcriptional regulator [Gammaproteobacteria bacterium]MCW8958403.1 AsnC family transcriptional regulator [Gammaproteobacteria bacterium]MCW8972115.1 AsnC family transcriptional regulator [Gammaproteobacteria bacterium]
MDQLDRDIINTLQQGFPICEQPYAEVAARLGSSEEELLARLRRLLDEGLLSRFGPMYHAERMGGGLTLAAMSIPEKVFEPVSEQVNRHPEVAHNYQRDHTLNMWFVLATETPGQIDEVIAEIEQETGYPVYNMPKEHEFFIGLRFAV